MPYFMDRHELDGASAEDIARAHMQDLAVQERYGVDYVTYWFDYARQHAFCLARGPSAEAVHAVHREAHGNLATQILDVDEVAVGRFMGGLESHAAGEAYEDSAFRAILFTDLVGSTDLTQRLGDAAAMDVLRVHDSIVRKALAARGGSEVKHTGDGIMASFRSAVAAVETAIAIQAALADARAADSMPVTVRIGIAAGEPVAEGHDLFGTAVQLAARVCARAKPDGILVAAAVRDLAQGKNFRFSPTTSARLKGFAEPVRVAEVVWRED